MKLQRFVVTLVYHDNSLISLDNCIIDVKSSCKCVYYLAMPFIGITQKICASGERAGHLMLKVASRCRLSHCLLQFSSSLRVLNTL